MLAYDPTSTHSQLKKVLSCFGVIKRFERKGHVMTSNGIDMRMGQIVNLFEQLFLLLQ